MQGFFDLMPLKEWKAYFWDVLLLYRWFLFGCGLQYSFYCCDEGSQLACNRWSSFIFDSTSWMACFSQTCVYQGVLVFNSFGNACFNKFVLEDVVSAVCHS